MYQETSQIHLNLSSIERPKVKKSNGHLSSISHAKGKRHLTKLEFADNLTLVAGLEEFSRTCCPHVNFIRCFYSSLGRETLMKRLTLTTPKGCVPFGESKNGFLILDLPDFSVERNVKSEIGFVTLVTFRQRVQYARQPLKK